MLMRALVGCSLATGALAFLPAPHLPAAVARAPVRSAPVMSSLFMEENSVADRIKDGLLIRYLPEDIYRVLNSWDRMVENKPFEDKDTKRSATSYIEGLEAKPWHDVSKFPWLQKLEENAAIVQEELKEAMNMGPSLGEVGNNVWASAARAEGAAYGPDWKTLVLQDRQWDETNSRIFPKTTQLLKDLGAPTVEVFFARQGAKTGIKPHTDGCNFILTAHLGLDVPEGQCWIKVGDAKREWRNGKAIAFDTHYFHETANEGDKDRYVLLIRFWHPGVTPKEREALQYVFDALDGPDAQTDLDFDYFNSIAERQLAGRQPAKADDSADA